MWTMNQILNRFLRHKSSPVAVPSLPPAEHVVGCQMGGRTGPMSVHFGEDEALLVQQDITGNGGQLLLTGGGQLAYRVAQGPHTVKIRLYRDRQMLAESLPYQVNSFCPSLSVTIAARDPIGIGRFTYSLRAVGTQGSIALAWRPWLTWVEGRAS